MFEPDYVREYIGGYDDWLRQSSAQKEQPGELKSKPTQGQPTEVSAKKEPLPKLSFKESKELEKLPSLIESLEASIAIAHEKMASPDFYKKPKEELAREQSNLVELESKLATAYSRWAELMQESRLALTQSNYRVGGDASRTTAPCDSWSIKMAKRSTLSNSEVLKVA